MSHVCPLWTELADKEQKEKEDVEINVNSDVQSHASPSHSVPDQSQNSDCCLPAETPDNSPAHHVTCNGMTMILYVLP